MAKYIKNVYKKKRSNSFLMRVLWQVVHCDIKCLQPYFRLMESTRHHRSNLPVFSIHSLSLSVAIHSESVSPE